MWFLWACWERRGGSPGEAYEIEVALWTVELILDREPNFLVKNIHHAVIDLLNVDMVSELIDASILEPVKNSGQNGNHLSYPHIIVNNNRLCAQSPVFGMFIGRGHFIIC